MITSAECVSTHPTRAGILCDILVDGVCWRPQWKLPYESGLTLMWKLAIVNAMTPANICAIFNRKLVLSDAAGLHGRSFLRSLWATDRIKSPSYFSKLIWQSGLNELAEMWVSIIASDQHIRYCPLCADHGYHSIIFQIEGLRQCPIHDIPLLDHCAYCHEKTYRFALTAKTMSSPFRCPRCNQPFGRNKAPASPKDFETTLNTALLAPVAAFLDNLLHSRLDWPGCELWQYATEEDEAAGIEKRMAVLTVLRRLIPIGMPERYFSNMAVQLYSEVGSVRSCARNKRNGVGRDRAVIYSRLKRYINRQLFSHHGESCLRTTRAGLRYSSNILYSDTPVCPLWFGYYLWVHHFEVPGLTPIRLRGTISMWPSEAEVDDRMWRVFCLWAYFAYLETARIWTTLIQQDDQGRVTTESLLLALGKLRIEMMPDWRAWPASLSFLRFAGSKTQSTSALLIAKCSDRTLGSIARENCDASCHH